MLDNAVIKLLSQYICLNALSFNVIFLSNFSQFILNLLTIPLLFMVKIIANIDIRIILILSQL